MWSSRFLKAQVFYLPPYSRDMNPIEMAFSKLKALLRQAPARTVDALVSRIGSLLDRFLPDECANFSTPQAINAQSESALERVTHR